VEVLGQAESLFLLIMITERIGHLHTSVITSLEVSDSYDHLLIDQWRSERS
jgi:hypothetical protein